VTHHALLGCSAYGAGAICSASGAAIVVAALLFAVLMPVAEKHFMENLRRGNFFEKG
jgi:hypothetical protein